MIDVETKMVEEIPRSATLLVFYVIYENPSDYPGRLVVRRQASGNGGILIERDPIAIVDSLAKARLAIPGGLFLVEPDEEDDPQILEIWC